MGQHVRLESRRVRLDPLAAVDSSAVEALLQQPEIGARWQSRFASLSATRSAESLWAGVYLQYAVRPAGASRNDPPLGIVVAYHPNHVNQTVWVGVAVAPRFFRSGLAFAALALFVEHLFRDHGYRQVYAEAEDANFDSFAAGGADILNVIGCYRGHVRQVGGVSDVHLVAIERQRWESSVSPLVQAALDLTVAEGARQP